MLEEQFVLQDDKMVRQQPMARATLPSTITLPAHTIYGLLFLGATSTRQLFHEIQRLDQIEAASVLVSFVFIRSQEVFSTMLIKTGKKMEVTHGKQKIGPEQ